MYYYREILRITEYWKYPVLPDETPYIYGQRLRYRFAFENDTVFIRDLSELYYRARYGGEQITKKEADYMKDRYYELARYVLTVRGPHRYFFLRYFRGIIAL